MNILERITAMITDLTENGFSGATGFTLIVAALLAILIFAVFGAMMKDRGIDNDN